MVDASLTAVLPYGRAGASSRVRGYDWLDRLGRPYRLHDYVGASNASPRTLVTHLPAAALAERELRRVDLSGQTLYLHREASPLSRGDLEVRLLHAADRSVFDFDDALQWDVARGLRALVHRPSKVVRCVRAADTVLAGSELLAGWASRFSREVHLVPSCVEPADYRVKTSYEGSGTPRLGWVGSPSTERYLRIVEEPLLRLHATTGARLVVVSAGAASLGRLDAMVDRVPWNAATLADVLITFDVAIAPLAQELYARGKCAYKILQYAAAALPVVGAPVGTNRQVLDQLGAASASRGQEWLTRLTDLLSAPPADRAAMGAAALSGVRAHYSFAAWEPTMAGLLLGDTLRTQRPAPWPRSG